MKLSELFYVKSINTLFKKVSNCVKTVNGITPDESGNVNVEGGGGSGTPGGYYAPSITQPDGNTMRVSYAASQEGMDAVPDVDLTLPQGDPGATPVKGTDYWTAEDKQAIVNDVLAALPTWEGGSY